MITMIEYEQKITFLVGRYGEEHQLIQTAEEAAELSHAAIKRHGALTDGNASADRLSLTRGALLEEIADVLIMIDQIMYAEGFTDNDVRTIAGEKLTRQIGRAGK